MSMTKVQVKFEKLIPLEKFRTNEGFDINPKAWKYKQVEWAEVPKVDRDIAIAEATKLDTPCVAIYKNEYGTKCVLAHGTRSGMESIMVIINAKESAKGNYFCYIENNLLHPLTKYLESVHLEYCKSEVYAIRNL